MKRLDILLALVVANVLSLGSARSQDQDYCKANDKLPECYCPAHPQELKCLRFFGSNPGFSSKGLGTSATFNSEQRPPPAKTTTVVTAPERASEYTLFIHYGAPKDIGGLPDATSLIKKLKERGFLVRGADEQRDPSGTAGIDYFREEDKETAKIIADSVNEWLKENGKPDLAAVTARRQTVRNPPGYIGVWIFGRPR